MKKFIPILLGLLLLITCENGKSEELPLPVGCRDKDCSHPVAGNFTKVSGVWKIVSFKITQPNFLTPEEALLIQKNVKLIISPHSIEFSKDPNVYIKSAEWWGPFQISCKPSVIAFTKTTTGAYFYNSFKQRPEPFGFQLRKERAIEEVPLDVITTDCNDQFKEILMLDNSNLALTIRENYFKFVRSTEKATEKK